jgi:sulfate transport system permease protein
MGGVIKMSPRPRTQTPALTQEFAADTGSQQLAFGQNLTPRVNVGGRALRARRGGRLMPVLLTGVALLYLAGFLLVPLVAVFVQAFEQGVAAYWRAISEPDAVHAMWLTFTVLCCVLPLNLGFGIAAAWAIARFEFPGKRVLVTIIDLPFAVSPVVSGLVFVLLFGAKGWLGPWVDAHNIRIIFALPGIVLATLFVTVPFVARELIPVMEELGPEPEEAALVLGASGWQMFWRVTLPNIKWGLLYGCVLLTARTIGEFGAVSVVSGHIRGQTNTVPLQVEILYNEYSFAAAFALASVLTGIALLSLVARSVMAWKAWKAGLHLRADYRL